MLDVVKLIINANWKLDSYKECLHDLCNVQDFQITAEVRMDILRLLIKSGADPKFKNAYSYCATCLGF